jgi:hypothetical protein
MEKSRSGTKAQKMGQNPIQQMLYMASNLALIKPEQQNKIKMVNSQSRMSNIKKEFQVQVEKILNEANLGLEFYSNGLNVLFNGFSKAKIDHYLSYIKDCDDQHEVRSQRRRLSDVIEWMLTSRKSAERFSKSKYPKVMGLISVLRL